MNDIHQHIIARLKQQPRHGGGVDPRKKAEKNAAANKAIDEANKDSKKKLMEVYDELNKSLLAVEKSDAVVAIGIEKLINKQRELAGNVQTTSKQLNILAQRNADLQKSFGLSVDAAGELGYKLDGLASKLGISRGEAEKQYIAISKLTGGTRQQIGKLQDLNKYYTINRGLTQKAADGLLAFAAAQTTGGSDDEIQKQILSQTQLYEEIEKTVGIQGARQTIEEKIGEAAAGTRLTFKKYPAQLGMAVMKAKALGLELADLETVGDNLLNIESSVGEELNYQLLTGRRLVDTQGNSLTNKYREAYLTGKGAEAAQTLANIITQEGDTLENNMLARKQMAKTLGIEENQLNSIVEKRKLIKGLTDSSGKPLSLDLVGKTGKELEDAIRKSMEGRKQSDIEAAVKAMAEKDDIRSPEAKSAASLASIEANGIKLQMTSQVTGTDGKTRDIYNAAIIADAANASTKLVSEFKTTMDTNFKDFIKNNAEIVGMLTLMKKRTDKDAASNYGLLLESIKATGGADAGLATLMGDAVKKIVDNIPEAFKNTIQGATITDLTVTNLNTGVVDKDDAVMINDGIRFNPRDKFRTINDGMTVAGTNVGGLDRYAAQLERRDRNFEQSMKQVVASMAAAVTTAIQRANLTVNIDRTFAGSSLNPRGKF
jgi:hypothetical protein